MKSAWKSKTLWFNFIAAFFLFANNFFLDNQLISNEIAGFVTVAVNFVLRFVTSKGIGTP